MFFGFLSSAKGQTTQTTPLIEARQEKTREFQTQLLHFFLRASRSGGRESELITAAQLTVQGSSWKGRVNAFARIEGVVALGLVHANGYTSLFLAGITRRTKNVHPVAKLFLMGTAALYRVCSNSLR